MRVLLGVTMIGGFSLAVAGALAQPPREGRRDDSAGTADSLIARLFAYDTNVDGKLSKTEITDKRLQPLFDRADADRDGVVSKQELQALYERESLTQAGGGRGGPPGGGPPGGPGGQGGPGMGAPPRPGEIMPSFLQDRLELTQQQKKQIKELQDEVNAKLAKILTKEQKQQLDEMRNNDRGPPGGPGGFGPPGRGPGGGGPGREGRPSGPGSGRPPDGADNR